MRVQLHLLSVGRSSVSGSSHCVQQQLLQTRTDGVAANQQNTSTAHSLLQIHLRLTRMQRKHHCSSSSSRRHTIQYSRCMTTSSSIRRH